MKDDNALYNLIASMKDELVSLRSALALSKPVYSHKELMALLDVSTKTIRKWRDQNLLGYSRVGDTYLYSKQDVEEFLLGTHYTPRKIMIRTKGRG